MAYVEKLFEIPDPTPVDLEMLPKDTEDLPERSDASLMWHLSGNQGYVEIKIEVGDESYLLSTFDFEEELIQEIESAEDVDAALENAENSLYEDPDWPGLDIGVGSAVLVLNWLGCITTSSCNGGAYGRHHHEMYPLVVFHATQEQLARITIAVTASGCLLHQDAHGAMVLYSDRIRKMLQFGRKLHDNERNRLRSLQSNSA